MLFRNIARSSLIAAILFTFTASVDARHRGPDWGALNAGAVSNCYQSGYGQPIGYNPSINQGYYPGIGHNVGRVPTAGYNYGYPEADYYTSQRYQSNPQYRDYESRHRHRNRNIALGIGAAVLIGVALSHR